MVINEDFEHGYLAALRWTRIQLDKHQDAFYLLIDIIKKELENPVNMKIVEMNWTSCQSGFDHAVGLVSDYCNTINDMTLKNEILTYIKNEVAKEYEGDDDD